MFATKIKPIATQQTELSDNNLQTNKDEQLHLILTTLYNKVINLENTVAKQQDQLNNQQELITIQQSVIENLQEQVTFLQNSEAKKPNVSVFSEEATESPDIEIVNKELKEEPTSLSKEKEESLINKVNNLPFTPTQVEEILRNIKSLLVVDGYDSAVKYYQEIILSSLDKNMTSNLTTENNFKLLGMKYSWCYSDQDITKAYKEIEDRILDTGEGINNLQQIVAAYNSLLEFNKVPF